MLVRQVSVGLVAAALTFLVASAALGEAKTFVGSGAWSDPAQWTPAGVPVATDDVIVNSGTVALDMSATVASYTMSNGTLNGSGSLTVTGMMTWQRGTIRGNGAVNANGGLTLSTTATVTLTDTRMLYNAGVATWTGTGTLSLGTSAVFNNLEGATFRIQTNANISGGVFNNAGTITKELGGGDGITTISSALNNSGTVTVVSGALYLGGNGTHSGTLTAQEGGEVRFTGGTHTVTGSVTSPDTMRFTGGTITFQPGSTFSAAEKTVVSATVSFNAGSVLALGDIEIEGGQLSLSHGGAIETALYTQTSGTLTGTDPLTVMGMMTWQRGTIRGNGAVNANGGLTLSTTATVTLTDTRMLHNAGVAKWTGTGALSLGTSAVFNNLEGATFQIQTNADMSGGIFNNAGTVTKELGGGDGITTISSALNNNGTVTVVSGALYLGGNGTHSGTLTAQEGAEVRFTGGTHSVTGSVTSPDTMRFAGGAITFEPGSTFSAAEKTVVSATVSFNAGSVLALGDIEIEGGQLSLSHGGAIETALYTQTSGTLTGTDPLTVTGMMTWQRGTIRGNGAVNANGGLTLSTTATVTLTDTRMLYNAGVATWTGTGALSLGSNAVFNNLEGATFQIQTNADMNGGIFNNAGTVTKELGSGDGITVITSTLNNSGLIEVLSGTLQTGGDYTQTAGATRLNGGEFRPTRTANITGGTLEGNGTLTGNVSVAGTGAASPGLSPGLLNIAGSYTQSRSASFKVDIGGLTAGTQFDRLAISGAATLDGRIEATLINGFTPNVGDSFEVMTFASRSGDFSDESGLVIGGGFGFRKITTGGAVLLQFAQEICNDGQDNDGDLLTDCADPKCTGTVECIPTPTATNTNTPTETQTPTITATHTVTATPTETATVPHTPTPSITPTPTDTPKTLCVGDCNADATVTVNELITGVNMALGTLPVESCVVFDQDESGSVEVNELIMGVNNALSGCPSAESSPSPTPTVESTAPPATPTVTVALPTQTPGDVVESVAGSTTVVVNAMGTIPAVVAAIVTGIEGGGASAALLPGLFGGGAGACPLGGTATDIGSFPFVTITLSACKVATNDGAATFDGTISVQLTSFTLDLSIVFENAVGVETETASADLAGSVSAALGGDCTITSATLTVNSGTLSAQTPEGEKAGVTFKGTVIAITNVTFNEDCFPMVYRMTFNGPASLFATTGEPFGVTFDDLVMDVNDSGNPTLLELNGAMESECFGGVATLATDPSLSVLRGEICPTGGTIRMTLPSGTAELDYQTDGSLEVDSNGDGMTDETFPNCLDPRLFMCAHP